MQIIVPMAGLGQRFVDAGYATPKPLIPILGLPMVVRVICDLPQAEKIVFIVHPHHAEQYDLKKTLRQHYPNCQVIVAPSLTAGQACTVRLAEPSVDWDDDVLVAACDATHIYDANRFQAMRDNTINDCIIWSYRGEPRVFQQPNAYGWLRTAPRSNEVLEVSCKHPISPNLLEDPVISGFFWFRSVQLMFSAIDRLVAENRRVNNEFYMDVVPNLLIEDGRRVVSFQVDKYIGWGTPDDLEEYQRRQNDFLANSAAA